VPVKIGRCGDCQHWDARSEKWGNCTLATTLYGDPSFPDSLAFAEDHEKYQADLRTRHDFGCVQFEAEL
jgi:hypothetical protein